MKKIIQLTIVIFSIFMLVGCATHLPSPQLLAKNLTTVPISADVNLNITQLWPLKNTGTYLQKIKTTVKNKESVFTVYLAIEKNKLDAIAFSDLAGRLYQLTWNPEKLTWQASRYIPSLLKPENILADFLLTHLSVAQLNQFLQGAQAYEKNHVRVIENNQGVLREIYDDGSKVTIINPKLGYKLEIDTVLLK